MMVPEAARAAFDMEQLREEAKGEKAMAAAEREARRKAQRIQALNSVPGDKEEGK
jgi:hypothetical protein